jgi:hypothetical protein
MNNGRTLILVDAIINLFLGIILLAHSNIVVDVFGIPDTDVKFYPNILGAVIFGIGIALIIEFKRKDCIVGLGLGGAISINLMGGIVLLIWLVFGELNIPLKGTLILWALAIILVGISLLELINLRKSSIKPDRNNQT